MFILLIINMIEMNDMKDIYMFCALRSNGAHQGPLSGHRSRPWNRRLWPQGVLKELPSKRRWSERTRRMSAGMRHIVLLLVHFFLLPDYQVGAITDVFNLPFYPVSLCARRLSLNISRIHFVCFPEYLGWCDHRSVRNSCISYFCVCFLSYLS
mgnify:CR=1 FL=1